LAIKEMATALVVTSLIVFAYILYLGISPTSSLMGLVLERSRGLILIWIRDRSLERL